LVIYRPYYPWRYYYYTPSYPYYKVRPGAKVVPYRDSKTLLRPVPKTYHVPKKGKPVPGR